MQSVYKILTGSRSMRMHCVALFVLGLLLFSAGTLSADTSSIDLSDLQDYSIYAAPSGQSADIYTQAFTHPQKHHHLFHRRICHQVLSKDTGNTTFESSNGYAGLAGERSYYTYSSYLRPAYYIFLFRCALF